MRRRVLLVRAGNFGVCMTRNAWIAICLAYIIGLLSTNFFSHTGLGLTEGELVSAIALKDSLTVSKLTEGIAFLSGLTLVSAIAFKKLMIPTKVWLSVAIVAISAVFYWQLRIPQPGINNIVYRVSTTEKQAVEVTGKVLTEPRLNASHKIKFWLKASEVDGGEKVSGKLYVSLPLLQGTGINVGEVIKLKGILYEPQAAITPGGFDFKAYLARQGIFAGMQGFEVISDRDSEPAWGWWKLRQRILRTHLRGLGSPVGQLVSSMVLGRKAVDLPSDLRDRFIEVGLAHVLAASGFHVSLLLGLILKLTARFAAKPRLIIGIGTLAIYLGLTGIQASVLRACLMGFAVLIALTLETKVKPLGSLLLAATIVLLFNPLLIGDLGFQLSFLATFGLIVTMPGLQTRLDWLPPTIAILVAVPLAASIWVLPLLCYEFNVLATYSIIVNILCTPLIMAISLGGMISAIAGLILPIVGSAIAWLLLYPTLCLIAIIDFFSSLPGSSWAIGQISFGVLITIYGLLILIWLEQKWRKHWRSILMFSITIIVIPIGYKNFNLTQITVLPTQLEPTVVIQDRGKTILINSGNSKAFQYTVMPFLSQQGINYLDYYLAQDRQSSVGIATIGDRLSVKNVIENSRSVDSSKHINKAIVTDTFEVYVESKLSTVRIETATETWLVLSSKSNSDRISEYLKQNALSKKSFILVGSSISLDWSSLNLKHVILLYPPNAIYRQNIANTRFYNLKQAGFLTWTPEHKFSNARSTTLFNSIF